MGIQEYFNVAFTISRQVWSNESSSEQVETSFNGHLQQATAELVEDLGLSFTKSFSLWCDKDTNIVKGDKITDSDSNTYLVRAVMSRNYNLSRMNEHLQVIVEKNVVS